MRNSLVKNERIMTNYSLIPRLFHTASDGKLGGWGTGSEAEQTVDGGGRVYTHLCCIVGEEPSGRPEAPWTVFCTRLHVSWECSCL